MNTAYAPPIAKAPPAELLLNFFRLRELAIEEIQRLSGDIWTDYNAHDPGIQIIDQLCYALTELGLYLHSDPQVLFDWSDFTVFPKPTDVLSVAPVTSKDWRLALADLPFVENVWIFAATQTRINYFNSATGLNYNSGESIQPRGRQKFRLAFQRDPQLGSLNNGTVGGQVEVAGISYQWSLLFPYVEMLPPDAVLQSISVNSITFVTDSIIRIVSQLNFDPPLADSNVEIFGTVTTALASINQPLFSNILQIALENPDPITNTIIRQYNDKMQTINTYVDRFSDHYQAQRNLCETASEITVVREQEVAIVLEVGLSADTDTQQFIVELFLALDEFISVRTHYQSFDELSEQGVPLDQLLEGPLLRKGFIAANETLADRPPSSIFSSDIVRIINLVGEKLPAEMKVVTINSLLLGNYFDGQEITLTNGDCLRLIGDERYLPVFSPEKSRIYVYKNFVLEEIDLPAAISTFLAHKLALQAQQFAFHPQQLLPSALEPTTVPYYSIQNEFPSVYSLKEGELSNQAPISRKAKVNQLKAYLLQIEQLLANQFGQIEAINELFSTDISNVSSPAVNLTELIPNGAQVLADSYATTLPNLAESVQPQQALQQKNAVLTHLLARFGEDTTVIDTVYASSTHISLHNKLARKSALLTALPALAAQRYRACNLAGPHWNTDNVATLVKKIALTLGFLNPNRRTLSSVATEVTNETFGEGLHLIEHLHLRPTINTDEALLQIPSSSDPYSFQLTLVLPSGFIRDFTNPNATAQIPGTALWGERLRDKRFRYQVEWLLQQTCPAHILARIHWLDLDLNYNAADEMDLTPSLNRFEQLFQNWLLSLTNTDQTMEERILAKSRLVNLLSNLYR